MKEAFSNRLIYFLLFLALTIFVISAGAYSFSEMYGILTESAEARRVTVSDITATLVQERLDRIKDLGISLASRDAFSRNVSEGNWEAAIDILEDIPPRYPYVDRIFLADTSGVLQVDTPALPGGVRGRDFSERDWYKGVSANWQPYVSDVYRRTAIPAENVVAAAFPIRDAEETVTGILVLQITLDTFFEWTKDIGIGEGGVVYIVDRQGQVVGHPGYSETDEIIGLARLTAVRRALLGESGLMISNEEGQGEQVLAFAPVPAHGWGVISSQPAEAVFARRRATLGIFGAVFSFLFAIQIILICFLIRGFMVALEQRREYLTLLQSIGDGVVSIDRNWTITYMNRVAGLISGMDRHEAGGKDLREVIRFASRDGQRDPYEFIRDVLEKGLSGHPDKGVYLIRNDGQKVPIADTAAPVFDANGHVVGAILIFRDATEEVESNRVRSSFAYAAHQLKNPVGGLLASLERATESRSKSTRAEDLKKAYISAKRIKKLSDQMEAVSRIDQSIVIVRSEKTDVAEVLRGVCANIRRDRGLGQSSCKVSIPKSPVTLQTAPDLLGRVLHEVIDNAVAYGGPAQRAYIDVSKKGRGVLIKVTDNGIGIPESEQAMAFSKFFRGSNFDPDEVFGAGLGLYISREFLRLLGGKIWFESKKGVGTTFHIWIPSRK